MDDITLKQFLFTQPNGEAASPTDKEYLRIANRLLRIWHNKALMQDAPDDLKKVVCIGLTGYYQDIISDAGVYRSFTDECKRLYGHRVPFHADADDYIDYELNLADVEFVLWYQLAFNSMSHRFLNPRDPRLLDLAAHFYKVLEDEYDDIPSPHDYTSLFQADIYDAEDTEKLHDLSQWLFWKNWLILPPFQLTFAQIYSGWTEIQNSAASQEEAVKRIEEEKQMAMAQLPSGPLALYMREWLPLILTGKMPSPRKAREKETVEECHPWYTAFINATGGKDMIFIKDYDELNDFFINSLGWKEGEEHLPQLKGHGFFALMVTQRHGLMVAKDIARSIKHPLNPYYDSAHASEFAFNLLSHRGVCPADMLRRLLAEGAIPDARFPETDDTALVTENADFIARVYLQEFYRGDN